MGPGDLAGDKRQGPIAPAVPFEPVGMDQHGMGDAPPQGACQPSKKLAARACARRLPPSRGSGVPACARLIWRGRRRRAPEAYKRSLGSRDRGRGASAAAPDAAGATRRAARRGSSPRAARVSPATNAMTRPPSPFSPSISILAARLSSYWTGTSSRSRAPFWKAGYRTYSIASKSSHASVTHAAAHWAHSSRTRTPAGPRLADGQHQHSDTKSRDRMFLKWRRRCNNHLATANWSPNIRHEILL